VGRVRLLLVWLSLVLVWLPSVGAVGSLGDVLTVASVVAVGVVVVLIGLPRAVPAPGIRVRARVLRERALRSAFLRTRDPDADGRVRPRAPGRELVAA
jgi:hypothetical protein